MWSCAVAKTMTITPSLEEITKSIQMAVLADPESRNKILIRAVVELKQRASAYPEEGIWNRPPGSRGDNVWYERGFGMRRIKPGGSIGGKPYFRGAESLGTSEKLQKNWKTEVQVQDTFTAGAFTEVTYAPKLLDPVRRVSWADEHGWSDLDAIKADYQPRFVAMILEEVDKAIEKL
jgi:hypothetical protein